MINNNIPLVKILSKDSVCNTCVKSDVCNLQDDLSKAINDIRDIEERTNVFIKTTISCKKYYTKVESNGIR
jgi:hypothetical protein